MSEMQTGYQVSDNKAVINEMGFFKRFIGILFSPGAVMENLAERPRVLFALLASFLTMPVFYLLRLPMFIDETRQEQLKAIPMIKKKMGIEMTAEMVEKQLPFTVGTGIVSIAFVGLIMLLFLTLIFFAISKIMGGQGKFKAYMSVTGYAYVIMILYFVITAIASFFTGSLYRTTSLTSLANLFPQSMKGQFIYGVVSGIDIFSIWYYAVIAIGLTKVSKVKKTYIYGAVFIVFVIGLLIGGFSAGLANSLA